MTSPLLYRAACRGCYGERRSYGRGGIADALFVYLDGEPDPEALDVLASRYLQRPWVCLTKAWEDGLRERFPAAIALRRWQMKPARRFAFPAERPLPAGVRVSMMDEAAFAAHPFSHGVNYASYADFRAEGSGAVARQGDAIVASASSFISMDGEVELDVSTLEAHRRRGLASACVARMLRDCEARGLIVHWDAQNETSLRMAERFGFELDAEYAVYWLKED